METTTPYKSTKARTLEEKRQEVLQKVADGNITLPNDTTLYDARVKIYYHEEAFTLSKATDNSSGYDIAAMLLKEGSHNEFYEIEIMPNQTALIPTGVRVAMPVGFEAQIRSRSGIAVKNNVFVLNSPGTIDADYRGEIKVILHNAGSTPFTVKHGHKIAQVVFQRVPLIWLDMVNELQELTPTQRGTKGFGSSGL